MSTISMFGTCQNCGLVQYLQGQPCRDCGGKVQSGGRQPETPCRTTSGAHCPSDPVPPAGGDVEVLGYSVKGNRYAIRLTKAELLDLYEGYTGDALVELVDRAHVTRLQAEVERLKQVAHGFVSEIELKDTELTKARELQADILQFIRELIDEAGYDWLSTEAVNKMKGYLSNQSAPADSGEV